MIPKEQEKTLSGSSLRAQQVKDLTLTVLWHWFDPHPKNIHVPWAQAKTNEENTLWFSQAGHSWERLLIFTRLWFTFMSHQVDWVCTSLFVRIRNSFPFSWIPCHHIEVRAGQWNRKRMMNHTVTSQRSHGHRRNHSETMLSWKLQDLPSSLLTLRNHGKEVSTQEF